MAKVIGLPKLSPTMEEGTLVAWVKQEGDAVEIDDLLAEVETDKATMEFRSFDRGVLLKILVPEGETLAPDVPVAIIGKAGEDISELLTKLDGGAPAPAPQTGSEDEDQKESENGSTPVEAIPAASTANGGSDGRGSGGRVLSSPLVRRLARERDIDLAAVKGSGPRGRVVKRDLEELSESAAEVPVSAGGKRPPPVVEPASSMRKTIARRLSESKREVPHYYLTIDIDVEPLLAARAEINAELEAIGEKISVNDMLVKGSAVALRRVPGVNVSWVDGQIHRHQVVDISVAVAVPDGLLTPVVRDADHKGLRTIAQEVRELASRAKAKRLKLEEMTGGTFSISNLGKFGLDEFSAVINPPEGAILAVGGIRAEPVVLGDAIVPGQRMRMTLSCDHRVIDGAVGAEFLAALKRILEAPSRMLL